MNMEQCFVALGSNLGDSAGLMRSALAHLHGSPDIQNLRVSRLYRTAAVTPVPQADYLNAVCGFHCALDPHALLHRLQRIEHELGQPSKCKDAPRYLDLDILFYGELEMDDGVLQLPHPRWSQRLFVLAPLYDLHASKDIAALISRCSDQRCDPIPWSAKLAEFSLSC